MKTTNRILALITALVLCLAPMALMIGAADANTDVVSPKGLHCSCINPSHSIISYDSYYDDYFNLSITRCCVRYYQNVKLQCNSCHIIFTTASYGKELTHHTFYYDEENDVYKCPKCGFEKP